MQTKVTSDIQDSDYNTIYRKKKYLNDLISKIKKEKEKSSPK